MDKCGFTTICEAGTDRRCHYADGRFVDMDRLSMAVLEILTDCRYGQIIDTDTRLL